MIESMELTPLRYFITIAQLGHMTRAAEKLGVTQPALSAMLRKLEQEVGTELLHRTGRGVEPTQAGKQFLTHAKSSVAEADAGIKAVRQLIGLEIGSIRLGAGATAASCILPSTISIFRKQHPQVRFQIREAGSRAIARAVLEGQMDLGIVTLPIVTSGPGAVPGALDLLTIGLVQDELMLIVPPGHRLSTRRTFRWVDLHNEPVVAFEANSAVRRVIDASARQFDCQLDVVMELRSIESIKQMVAAGIGVGFVSRFALANHPDQRLRCKDSRLLRELALIRRRDRLPSSAAAAFEQVLLKALQKKPNSTS